MHPISCIERIMITCTEKYDEESQYGTNISHMHLCDTDINITYKISWISLASLYVLYGS